MGFFSLRRSASVTDLPVIPPAGSPTGPFRASRKLALNPDASASTNDLPSFSTRPRSPSPPRGPPLYGGVPRSGSGGAFGPKAGARFLASKEAQRALRKADEIGGNGDDFSMRDRVAVREDGGLSTITPSERTEDTQKPSIQPLPQDSSSGSRTRSGATSTGHGVRRVPVPAFEQEKTFVPHMRREGSIQELTRKASQEEQQQDEEAARRRKASLSKASGAGLASPFAPPALTTNGVLDVKKRRGPPVSGLNKTPLPEVDEQGRHVANIFPHPRQRSASADSKASISKDVILTQLSDGIKRERKKAEMYEREAQQSEVELAEIGRNLDVLKEKFATTLEQQAQVIKNLEAEIEEVKSELEVVNDLDEAAAQEYLALLTSPSLDALKARTPVVSAFNPNALTSTSSTPPVTPAFNTDKSKFSALALRRGLNLKRRVDTHVAAYDTVASNVAVPKPALPRHSTSPTAGTIPLTDGPKVRPRKLSKIRAFRPETPTEAPAVSTVLQQQPAPAVSVVPVKPAPPPPGPVFRSLSSDAPSPLDAKPRPLAPGKSKKRPPPVTGVSQRKVIGGALGAASDSEAEDGGVKGRQEPGRTRKNSLTRALSGTMRVLFPSNAPKQHSPQRQHVPLTHVQAWLHSDNPNSGDTSTAA
ncbi:hypothetical protein JCM10213v2_008856 [Rhodosporidiobolus nylandii]